MNRMISILVLLAVIVAPVGGSLLSSAPKDAPLLAVAVPLLCGAAAVAVRSIYQFMNQDARPWANSKDITIAPLEVDGCTYREEFVQINGHKVLVRRWDPLGEAVAVVCICHGYGDHTGHCLLLVLREWAQRGFAVVAVDYPGHGRSTGLHGYIPDFNCLCDTAASVYISVRNEPAYADKKAFLYGESMGGAVAINIANKNQNQFQGMVLVAPMCQIKAEFKPSEFVINTLKMIEKVLPTLPIVPTSDLKEVGYTVKEKVQLVVTDPWAYNRRPRLRTALQLLIAADYISAITEDIKTPFLILHGSADRVTDPQASVQFHQRAKSEDKTLKMYEGYNHTMTFGETDEKIQQVFDDIAEWLAARAVGKREMVAVQE